MCLREPSESYWEGCNQNGCYLYCEKVPDVVTSSGRETGATSCGGGKFKKGNISRSFNRNRLTVSSVGSEFGVRPVYAGSFSRKARRTPKPGKGIILTVLTAFDSKRRSGICRGPRLKQTTRKHPLPPNPFRRGTQQQARRQQELQDACESAESTTEAFDDIIQMASTIVEKTVVRAPTPKRADPVSLPPIQEEESVLDKMDTPVREWALGEGSATGQLQTVAEVHGIE